MSMMHGETHIKTITSFVGCSQGIRLNELWTDVLPPFH